MRSCALVTAQRKPLKMMLAALLANDVWELEHAVKLGRDSEALRVLVGVSSSKAASLLDRRIIGTPTMECQSCAI